MINDFRRLSTIGRRQKIALQLLADAGLILFCFVAAMTIRLESTAFFSNLRIWVPACIAAAAAIGTFGLSGLYRTLVRFVTGKVLTCIAKGALVFALVLLLASSILEAGVPRSVPIISGILLFLSIGGLRFLVRHIFRRPLHVNKRAVVIYGAGEAGLELLNSLFHGRDYSPIAFIDDDPQLHGLTIGGLPVYSPQAIPGLSHGTGLDAILLAMPNLTHARRKEIFVSLEGTNLEVKTTPALSDIISGKSKISELRNISAEDLLGRDPVIPDKQLLKRNIQDKSVLVSGAGGSIGSELCRQIIAQGPAQLILYEISEFALYSIEQELVEKARQMGSTSRVVPILGSVQDKTRTEAAIKSFKVETIFHAAAYKHVPIVEENVVEGIQNNVFGTLTIARLALANKVRNFILISTDKAVRPTNVMGATKRIAELVCQAFAQDGAFTKFSMVRFGNVLGSSGSVIPRFQSQIEAGGPVTVTHPDINRYFMTIPEASQLVIQAGAMAKGGDVFVLDMGQPVRIADLAMTMVKLHGLRPYFVDRVEEIDVSQGDIPICFTGLRKGEKLFEELLIGNNPQPTEHPRVMSAKETAMLPEELLPALDDLLKACSTFDLYKIQRILGELPLDYTPRETHPSDLVWLASQNSSQKPESERSLVGDDVTP